jgi:hypothetical protein
VYTAPLGLGYVVKVSSGSPNVSDSKTIGTGNGVNKSFGGTLHAPVTAGSVVVTAGGVTLSDGGSTNGLAGSGGSGFVAYSSGAIGVTFTAAPAIGTPVVVRYAYGNVFGSGSSAGITSLSVQQQGNKISISDNHGDRYAGVIGSGQITGSRQTLTNRQDIAEVFQFNAEGTSAGVPVKMTGTFQAAMTVYFAQEQSAQADQFSFSSSTKMVEVFRTASLSLQGSWVEPNRSGEINGIGPQNERIESLSTTF